MRIMDWSADVYSSDLAPVTAKPLLHDDPRDRASLPCPGSVTKEEALAITLTFGVGDEGKALIRQAIAAREVDVGRGECVDDRLELGRAQDLVVEHPFGKLRPIVRRRSGDGRTRGRLAQRAREIGRAGCGGRVCETV